MFLFIFHNLPFVTQIYAICLSLKKLFSGFTFLEVSFAALKIFFWNETIQPGQGNVCNYQS